MEEIAIFRINYKSDFILTLNSDAGWMTPFCIKFWTGAPSQAYFAGFDGTTYTHCAPVEGDPTKLTVQFDDHHLPIGDLKFQIGYHFTVADFPTTVEDEVLNQASVIIEVDGEPAQVMLDFNGDTAPEIEFSLPAYANEAQRIANEEQRIENEQARISAENERISNEDARIAEEQVRVSQEAARVSEFAQLKEESQEVTADANAAAQLANEKAAEAQQKAVYAQTQGDYAKAQGDIAQADHTRAESDHTTATADHTQAAADHAQAAADHTRADSDHTRAESDHEAVELYVDSLGAFDISAYHATGGVLAKYADLAAALGTDGANIPYAIRKGGMSVKFVLSSDNNSTKYVQYRLMKDTFSITPADWQGVDDEPTAGSENLVKSGGVDGVLEEIEKATIGYKDGNTFNISSSYLTRRKDFTYIPIEAGKSYAVKVTAFTGAEISGNNNGVWFYSSADSADVPKAALVRQVGALYEFTCVNAGVLRVYCLSGAENDSVECNFTLFDSDSLETKKADDNAVVKHSSQSLTDGQKSQARTNIGAASASSVTELANNTPTKTEFNNLKSFVDDNVVELDKEQFIVTEKYTKSSFDAEHSANAYLRFSTNTIAENTGYYCVWFYAEKAGSVYVSNLGIRPQDNRMVVGAGTITSYPNIPAENRFDGESDTFPSESSPISVNAGDLVAMSFNINSTYSENDIEIVYNYNEVQKFIPNENIRKYDEVLGLLNNHILIKRVSNTEIRIHVPTKDGSKYLIHPIKHNSYTHDMTQWGGSSSMVCGDNWDPGDISDTEGNLIVQGNLNFIYMVDSSVEGFENENLHVGTGGGSTAGHGLEVREYTKFFADGKEFTPEDMTDDIVCSTFRLIQKSNCYAADKSKNPSDNPNRNYENWPKLSSGNPVVTAQHFVDAVYEVGNKVTWRNRLVIKRNGVVFNQLHGGMLRSFTSKLDEVVVNDLQSSRNHFEYDDGQYIITPIGDSVNLTNVNRYADEATMYGDGIVVHQRMIQDDGTRFKKSIMSCTDYHLTNLLSFKCYFMPALVSERSTVSAAETFNNNDIISVTNYREIDVW